MGGSSSGLPGLPRPSQELRGACVTPVSPSPWLRPPFCHPVVEICYAVSRCLSFYFYFISVLALKADGQKKNGQKDVNLVKQDDIDRDCRGCGLLPSLPLPSAL